MAPKPFAILVVDDDDYIRSMFSDYFALVGYPVRTAPDGVVALNMLRAQSNRFGLVLLDLMMPRMDGYQFREAQVAEPSIAHIPVIVLSASKLLRDRGLPRGIPEDHGFMKPPDFERLLILVERYCGPAPDSR